MDRDRAVMALRLIAAKAAMMADEVQRGVYWPGQYEAGLAELAQALETAEAAGKR